MITSQIWTLSTDTDNGLQTSIHISEFNAWLVLIGNFIGERGDLAPADELDRAEVTRILIACAPTSDDDAVDYSPLVEWFSAYTERHASCDSYTIDSHDIACAYDRDQRALLELTHV